jgi:nitroimidazol reductase NimA-like FMN-containing flavoprotein (pyridoxamine 5'-phosphate oxidase superfamily)
MQYRMKKHPLSEEQITEVLEKTLVGNIATINENGYLTFYQYTLSTMTTKFSYTAYPEAKK